MSGTLSAAAPASAATSTAPPQQTSQSALASLTDNYQTFLKMLTTQLQNQDPTSPMDSSQFTSELVQFAGVEQQINTNSNLTQLIQLAQGSSVEQSSQMLGKHIRATSSQLSLQQGNAQVDFNVTAPGPVAIAVTDSNGNALYSTMVTAAQGGNSWTWNGQTSAGPTVPDGAYTVMVNAVATDGSTTALPFTIEGTATSVQEQGSTVLVQLGALSVNMSAVTAVTN
jgi:flagellar basal-body rod modification protein FlgD